MHFRKKNGCEKLTEIIEGIEAEECDYHVRKIRMDPVKIPETDISKPVQIFNPIALRKANF